MQRPLQITTRDIPDSAAIDAYIRERVEKLELFYPHIVGCHVVVEMPHKHRHQGKLFNVRIEIKVPGSEIVVNRELDEDVYVVLRDAFDAAKRALEDYGRKQRGDVKFHEPVATGTVAKLFGEGYGFIDSEAGEIYFDRENVVNQGFDKLEIGDQVHFIVEPAGEGFQAKRVSRR